MGMSSCASHVLLVHGGHVGLAHDDALVGDAHDDVAVPEAALAPEAADGGPDRLAVLDLAVDDRPRGQGHLAEAEERGPVAAEVELGGPNREGADVEADHTGCHQCAPRAR
jgi:hypothetical protein